MSEGRLVDFLDAEELQKDSRTVILPTSSSEHKKGEALIEVSNGTFTWNAKSDMTTLKGIDFVARKGELVAVLGRVGDGKVSSHLLKRLLVLVPDDVLFGGCFSRVFFQQCWVR